MHVAVVGAGFAGLVTAKTLTDFGHQVTVFELSSEVGGVWSRERRYPGVRTQNSKQTYCLSSLLMPKKLDDHPEGAQVQAYLETFVDKELDRSRIKLETEVVKALPEEKGWRITTRTAGGVESAQDFDHLCICSGSFSRGKIPAFSGSSEFEAAGGRVLHSSDLRYLDVVSGKNVVVVGYGKSACDSAQAIQAVAQTTHVAARSIIWKLPTWLAGLHYSYLLLTRFGEALFEYFEPWPSQRFLNGPGKPIRTLAMSTLAWITRKQLKLSECGLLPTTSYDTIARSNISLATPDFYESILATRIVVHRGATITSLGLSTATLSSGVTIPCDIVVCGTGFIQTVPFLLPTLTSQLTDSHGNWLLYRHILPSANIANLSFNGFNSSLFCPLTAEITSLWIATSLAGGLALPDVEQRRRSAERKLAWMEERSRGKHACGTSLVPFSLSHIDELLGDLHVQIGWGAWLRQWVLPVDPAAYAGLGELIRARLGMM